MLNNKSFFTQLNLALHWYLPQPEADEVREDYRDIQRQAAEAGEVFPPKEDNPLKIARNLSDRREYRRWLLAFGVMLACPLAVGAYLVNYYFPLFDWQNSVFFTQMFFWLGLLAALYRGGRGHGLGRGGVLHRLAIRRLGENLLLLYRLGLLLAKGPVSQAGKQG